MVNERELIILRLVVDAYVRDGVPVSSLAVRDAGSSLSTASIRNVMAKLEEEGYVSKPHTSSGRVPTDKGYRAYVDHLEGTNPVRRLNSSRVFATSSGNSTSMSTRSWARRRGCSAFCRITSPLFTEA